MYLSLAFALFITGTSLLQVNAGSWLRDVESFENQKRSLPNEINLNGEVKRCGAELADAKKCSCQALICDGKQSCEHATKQYGPMRYVISCRLMKPWDEVNTQAATTATFGGPGHDCDCKGRAILAH